MLTSKPLDIFNDGLDIFGFLLGRIRVIEPERKGAAIFLCQSVIEADTFGVSDVEVSVRFRRKSGGDSSVVLAGTEVLPR